MTPLELKLALSVLIFAAGWLGGEWPLRRGAGPASGNFMSWGNAFAAGVFLGTGLIHMLGEAHEAWGALGWNYPMAQLLAALSFMLMLLFEHVVLSQRAHAVVHAHSGERLPEREIDRLSSGRYPFALLLALSIHSVIAGVALGAQGGVAGVLYIFLAILAHKSSEAFALGVSLARSHLPGRRSRTLLLSFAAATPLGVLLGAMLTELVTSSGARYFDAVFTALAAGTFIYIAAVDIIQDEFLQAGGRFVKWLFAAGALALTAVLSLWL